MGAKKGKKGSKRGNARKIILLIMIPMKRKVIEKLKEGQYLLIKNLPFKITRVSTKRRDELKEDNYFLEDKQKQKFWFFVSAKRAWLMKYTKKRNGPTKIDKDIQRLNFEEIRIIRKAHKIFKEVSAVRVKRR